MWGLYDNGYCSLSYEFGPDIVVTRHRVRPSVLPRASCRTPVSAGDDETRSRAQVTRRDRTRGDAVVRHKLHFDRAHHHSLDSQDRSTRCSVILNLPFDINC